MKYLIAIALFAAICAVVKTEDVCHDRVTSACNIATPGVSICGARFGGIDHVENEVQAYINAQLAKSYEYLLMATFFNSYQKNRPGFQKLYQGLSDRSFDDSIDLIKQLTRRGGKVNFNTVHLNRHSVDKLEVDELHSLAIALDIEKDLANSAVHVHTYASHGSSNSQRANEADQSGGQVTHNPPDPEFAQYLEEKFLSHQAESVRKLSGYVNDLSKMMVQPDTSLAVYLFDEYLQKQ